LDKDKIVLQKNQKHSTDNNFVFVKGSDYYNGYYNENIIETKYVRYYQIAMFNDFPTKEIVKGLATIPTESNRCIRSFLLKGQSSKGACFFEWRVMEVKDYKIPERKLDKFIKFLNKNNKNTNLKLQHKFYPVYNFKNIPPPSGNDINECVSELLWNN
jgi:hypothetical protein